MASPVLAVVLDGTHDAAVNVLIIRHLNRVAYCTHRLL
jgi:hypothetical protein